LKDKDPQLVDRVLNELAKDEDGKPLGFHNHSQLDFRKLKGDPDNIGQHLAGYIKGFSENIQKIFERFEFEKEIENSKRPTASIRWLRSSPKSTCTPPCGQHHHGAGVRRPDPALQRGGQ
jgi:hypothetical protein